MVLLDLEERIPVGRVPIADSELNAIIVAAENRIRRFSDIEALLDAGY